MLRLLAALAAGLLLSSGASAQADCLVNTNRVTTVIFPSSLSASDLPITDGVTLRATDPRGQCVGEVVWSEDDGRALVLRGGDASLSDPGGLLDGEAVTLSAVIGSGASPLAVSASDLHGNGTDALTFVSGGVFVVSGLSVPVGHESAGPVGPLLTLDALAPNPSAAEATLQYRLGATADVASEVFDLLGRRLLRTESAARAGGGHTLALDVRGLPAGAYLARLTAHGPEGAAAVTRRFTVSR